VHCFFRVLGRQVQRQGSGGGLRGRPTQEHQPRQRSWPLVRSLQGEGVLY